MATFSPHSPQGSKGEEGGDLSSASSTSDPENEYVVDRIIAQIVPDGNGEGEEMYLVRWEGYPDERCTWEPRESFLSSETLEQWNRDKAQKQTLSPDEVKEVLRKMDVYAEMQEEKRKQRRARKERMTKNGRSRSAAASKINQSPMESSRRELPDPQEPAGSRLVAPHKNAEPVKYSSVGHSDSLLSSPTKPSQAKKFQGIGIEPRARKSSLLPSSARQKGAPGTHFKTLATQYRHQKAGRNEPAPDLEKIKLKSATDIVAAAGEDIAHILPSGNSRSPLSHDADFQRARILPDHVDEPESVEPTPASAIQMPPTSAELRRNSDSGNVGRIPSAPKRFAAGAVDPKRRDVRYLPSGRYWILGEVLIHLTVHGQVVGDVRLGGLPGWFKSKLIALKVEHRIVLDFQLVETGQYDALCQGRSNELLSSAYIEPFDDTRDLVTELVDSLDYNNRAALWYHPDVPYVLVAYAAMSKAWQFLDGGNAFPPESQIHLALRNGMPKVETLAAPQAPAAHGVPAELEKTTSRLHTRLNSSDVPMEDVNFSPPGDGASRITEKTTVLSVSPLDGRSGALADLTGTSRQVPPLESHIGTTSKANNLHDSEAFSDKGSSNPWLGSSSVEVGDEDAGPLPESMERPALPFEFSISNGESVDAVFQTRFGISYHHLTRPSVIPVSRKDILDPRRARFYLAFPLACQAEMEALRALLSAHTLPNLICTSGEPLGWDGFKTILGDKGDHIGVIIFHATYTNYSELPGLATLLKMVNVNLFNVSLRHVLPYSDLPIHIERLFPNGTAMLVTESSMTQQPERTLAILRWFSQTVKTKRGTWKIVLIPNVKHWLRQTAIQAGPLQACFLDMLKEITELSLGQPATYRSLADDESEAESLDGWDDEIGRSSLVVSPANIPTYDRCYAKGNGPPDWERDRVLVEWFAGWAAQNAQRHRKFPAVSGVAALLNQEPSRWGHLEIVDPNKYMTQNKISF